MLNAVLQPLSEGTPRIESRNAPEKWLSTRKPLDLADDEAFPRGLHNSLGYFFQRIDFEDSLHLREQPVQQPEVATGSAANRVALASPASAAGNPWPPSAQEGPSSFPRFRGDARHPAGRPGTCCRTLPASALAYSAPRRRPAHSLPVRTKTLEAAVSVKPRPSIASLSSTEVARRAP